MACSYAKKAHPARISPKLPVGTLKLISPLQLGKSLETQRLQEVTTVVFFHINDDSISSIMLNVHIEYDYNILNTEYM